MFEEKDLIRKEVRQTKNGHRYKIGVYNCKSCGKEVYKNNRQAKKQSGYCIRCANKQFKTKSIQVVGFKICKTCLKSQDISQFSKNSPKGHPPNDCNRCRNLRKFGLTSLSYDNILCDQNYRCAICNNLETSKVNGRKSLSLAVDHDHKTNKVRGLLCVKCNMALGLLNEDREILLKAIKYLEYNLSSC